MNTKKLKSFKIIGQDLAITKKKKKATTNLYKATTQDIKIPKKMSFIRLQRKQSLSTHE